MARKADDLGDNVVRLFAPGFFPRARIDEETGAEFHEIRAEAPPLDCRLKWGGRTVLISDTTALLLAAAFADLARAGRLRATSAASCEALARAFDECRLIERDVFPAVKHGLE